MISETLSSTIAAIATPSGEGGIAIVRISGPYAIPLCKKIFSKNVDQAESHTVHFGKIKGNRGEVIDDVLLLLMKGPKTFTGEDVVEIHCHGGALISKLVLQRVLQEGALLARPGEFSERAFLNGKMDLSQAEAIQSLISAKNEHALKAAQIQLQGGLRQKILSLKESLTGLAAIFEAWVDFPEEGLEFATTEEVIADLEKAHLEINLLLKSFHFGKFAKEGIKLALIGAPNVGKSSLMNALIGKNRAIVSPIAGTTRDTVDAELQIGGFHVVLTDTAGIRDVGEEIEQEGIKRSKEALQSADLILFLADGTKGWTEEEQAIAPLLPQNRTFLVWNKIDLPHQEAPTHFNSVKISAKENLGIETLKSAIESHLFSGHGPTEEGVVLTELRHEQALQQASTLLQEVILGLKSTISPEFLLFDLRSCLKALGTIIGSDITEDILSAIFSRFCIGK